MATTLTDENIGEVLQPIFDAAAERFGKELTTRLNEDVPKIVSDEVAKAMKAETPAPEPSPAEDEFELSSDPAELEKQAVELEKAAILAGVDRKDPASVRAAAEKIRALEKGEAPAEPEPEGEELRKARQRVRELEGRSNQSPDTSQVALAKGGDGWTPDVADAMIAHINGPQPKQEA